MLCVFLDQVYVEVLDVNDNVPRPLLPAYWPAVEENAPPHTLVVTVAAHDADQGTQLAYSIVAGNPQSLFVIDKNTGQI